MRLRLFCTLLGSIFCLLLLATAAKAQGFNMDYLPFDKSRLRPFHLQRVAIPNDFHGGKTFSVAGVTIVEEEEKKPNSSTEDLSSTYLVFRGAALNGKQWELRTESCLYCDAVYQGDLDRNGTRDLIISSGTGGNGLAPPTTLIFLTFDRNGWPTMFQTTGYYDPTEAGIVEVADLDGDRRAELLQMNYDDGYWITGVYRLRNGHWSQVLGQFAGLKFPLYTRFTKRPNHRPVKPAPGRHPHAPNLIKENAKGRKQ